jgi:CDP-glucose 4,6-dehydratase
VEQWLGAVEGVAVSFWERRNVLVTGATGLLGPWLVEELLARGARVTCLVRDWVPESRFVNEGLRERVQIVRGELEDLATAVRALNEYEIDSVFHLGAQAIVGTAARSPLSTFESNIRGTWILLEACRLCPSLVERVIVASSDKAYGIHEQLPYTEEARLEGCFPYDVSKSCADLISFSYQKTYGTPLAVTRCGNLYGGGDLNWNRLVPGTIVSALRGEAPLIRSDGTYLREYFYVRDAALAYLALAERLPEAGFVGEAFNFASDQPLSVLALVQEILRATGRTDLEPVVLSEASAEIPEQSLDCSKAKEKLGWGSTWSLEDGLRDTVDWYTAWLDRQTRG